MITVLLFWALKVSIRVLLDYWLSKNGFLEMVEENMRSLNVMGNPGYYMMVKMSELKTFSKKME